MEIIAQLYKYYQDHQDAIFKMAGALYAFLTVVNGLLKDSPEKSILGKLINFIAILARDDAQGTFKRPLSNGKPSSTEPGLKIVNVLLPVAIIGLVFSGCSFCRQPANALTARCVAQSKLEQCGTDALTLVPSLLSFVLAQDWAGLVSYVERSVATQEGACILSALEPLIFGQGGAAAADAYKAAELGYLVKHAGQLNASEFKHGFELMIQKMAKPRFIQHPLETFGGSITFTNGNGAVAR